MTALLQDRVTSFGGRHPDRGSYKIKANVQIFKDSIVCIDSAGRAQPGGLVAAGALRAVGKSSAWLDNRTGSPYFSGLADATDVETEYGIFEWANSAGGDAITAANVGQVAYVVDDQTVALTDGGGTRCVAGIITEVRASKPWILMGPEAIAGLLQDVAAPAVSAFRARNVVNGNIADLNAYTVAANPAVNDNVLGVAGDIVLLIAQTTPAQNGLYVIGTVTTGTAPLTRLTTMAAGLVFLADAFDIAVGEGAIFAHTKWFNSAAGTIGTNTPAFFPRQVTISQALVAGTMTITSIPVLSVTKSRFGMTRRIANTSTATTGGYHTTVGGANGVTAGALGTASVTIEACVAAGTINNADISTLEITVYN